MLCGYAALMDLSGLVEAVSSDLSTWSSTVTGCAAGHGSIALIAFTASAVLPDIKCAF
jgi:hypothetical protein